MAQQPSASIPQACQHWPEIKAAYRFLSNPRIAPKELLQPHVQATVGRMQAHRIVLALQDTTSLNYSTQRQTEGLGPVANQPKSLGFFLHTTLAVTTEGCPLGTLQAQTYSRSAAHYGQNRRSVERNKKPVAQKESQRWLDSLAACQQLAGQCPHTQIVNIADREGDIYELFAQALSVGGVHLLIRQQHNRNVTEPNGRLWSHLAGQTAVATMRVQVPRKGGQKARVAQLALRFCAVQVAAPLLKEGQPTLPLWAIEARETGGPQAIPPILWRLLTTLPMTQAAEAVERVGWYARRWQIEMLHKVLKSGCQIERRQLETKAALARLLMLDLIIAWRLLHLTKTARQQPEQSSAQQLSETEWRILWWKFKGNEPRPAQPPSLGQAVRWIAQLGGFIGRKSDGDPGVITLWRGLQRLHDLSEAFSLTQNYG